ncbi:hypothetical protein BHF71_11110 [Vulcanibacillus modesticaldus]|uniref:Copper amine oxidase-like N-terminal domain-containing protein n=1 Tax=Vulcanibacillus modesticaldus TaxID=337097 RepID=A0A1D2YSM5_9BACI|nr:hypothetical protein [Vulcanibacillus modesticaldus]OEF97693.1 hypothetical protein BHF71_11110 [Vulcanibacillus modesticaldus]
MEMKRIFVGIIIGAILTTYHPALANSIKQITALVKEINIQINGKQINEGNTYFNGKKNVPLALNYEGTTYVPFSL